MSTGMRVTNPKLSKGGRKLKKEKHCTIPKTLHKNGKEKSFKCEELNSKSKSGKKNSTMESMQNDAPSQV